MALSANITRILKTPIPKLHTHSYLSESSISSPIYSGAICTINPATGRVHACVAGEQFVGISQEFYNNNGNCELWTGGEAYFDFVGASQTNVGKPVYASDDNTITLTSAGNTLIGNITGIWDNGYIVQINSLDIGEVAIGNFVTIFAWDYHSIIQGVWAMFFDATQYFGFKMYNTSNTDGDGVLYKVPLSKGTYTINILSANGPGGGIIDVRLNTTLVGSYDRYNIAVIPNVFRTFTNVSLPSSGIYDIKLITNGTSMVSYYNLITSMTVRRTA